jgi:hypothetical protein
MVQISASEAAKNDQFNFILTYTLRNENVKISTLGTNYVVDTDGAIHEISKGSGRSVTISVVGGLSTFVNAKIPSSPVFYLTTNQKRTLQNIMRFVASNSNAVITSNDETLEDMLNGQYYNFRG